MVKIADREKIERILERIAYQIAEIHCHKKKIILVGIHENGYILAKEMANYLLPILKKEAEIISLKIDKTRPETSSIELSQEFQIPDNAIILVDDVINSGKTFFYALRPFFDMKIDELQTLILVERKYKRFPIVSDFVGMSLNTTLKEHIEVVVENGKINEIILR